MKRSDKHQEQPDREEEMKLLTSIFQLSQQYLLSLTFFSQSSQDYKKGGVIPLTI
ncbi:hypothetical protein FOC52_14240 (plasmid) [Staphylococcus cohnii]|nr:hypothetical protein FOC52_14240 [Staphylococcus cohnii]